MRGFAPAAAFGAALWASPLAAYPLLAQHLPPMTPVEVQARWTGSTGEKLLGQSLSFVRSCSENYTALSGSTLHNARILDLGFWLWRLGFGDRVRQSAALPQSLPFEEKFAFAFAFSVFTHLNEGATILCLRALRRVIKEGGILCITIRPPEYWEGHFTHKHRHAPQGTIEHYQSVHHARGFAFLPHGAKPDDPEATYGDRSMTIECLQEYAKGWNVMAVDRALEDPM